jgi:hypothetical protein
LMLPRNQQMSQSQSIQHTSRKMQLAKSNSEIDAAGTVALPSP